MPSLTTATVFCLIVSDQTLSGSAAIAERDAADARRVRDREVVARLQRRLRGHLELAAEVGEEGPVGDVLDLDPVQMRDGFEDPLHVRAVRGEEGDVADLVPAPDPHEVDRAEQAACVADRLGELGERAGVVLQTHAHRRAERRRGMERRMAAGVNRATQPAE